MSEHLQSRSPAKQPVAPPRFDKPLPLHRLMKVRRRNLIAAWTEDAFEADFIPRKLLFRRLFVVNDPDGVKRVLVDNAANYGKAGIANKLLEPGLGKGLLTSDGTFWRRQRRIAAPSFHPRRIQEFGDVMAHAAQELVDRWEGHVGEVIDVADEMLQRTILVIARTMFSSDLSDEVREISAAVTTYFETIGRVHWVDMLGFPSWTPRPGTREGLEAVARLDRSIYGLIERRRASGEDREDLLSLLMNAVDEETGEQMDQRQLRDEVATMLVAGHETTANALSWTWYLLSEFPEVEARLHEELDRELGGRQPLPGDLGRLPYLRMVLSEVLRLYPPGHTIERDAHAEDEICGHRIPAGSTIMISPWLLHRHKRLWERPDDFDPEHFAPERAAERHRYAYLPFGGGPRVCIGASFAMTEASLIVATVAQRYRLRLVDPDVVEPVGLVTLRPKNGLPMTLERR